jgi:hypothetical protein
MHWAYLRACCSKLFDAPEELEPPDDAAPLVVDGLEVGDPPPHAPSVTAKAINGAPNRAPLPINNRRRLEDSGLPGESDIVEAPFGSGPCGYGPVLRPFAVSPRLHPHG